MKDLPNLRRNDRNAPFIELTNDTDSTGNITEFHLTIGDTRFNFSDATLGVFAKLAKTTPRRAIRSASKSTSTSTPPSRISFSPGPITAP
jgi:hypothetical protein